VSNGKIRREVLVAYFLIAIGVFVCIMAYLAVSIQIDVLDLARLNTRGSINNLTALLTLLAVGCLFLGAVSGFLIGKYRHT
jgi:multisubunit Na+/H+ antiporter MnhG subunit